MPLRDYMQHISVDDHVIEHPNVWLDRLPQKNKERGPRMIETELNTRDEFGADNRGKIAQVWIYEDRQYPRPALDATAGRPQEEFSVEPYTLDDILPGCYEPLERVKDMDRDKIQAQLCFPTFPRFAGTLFLESQDKDLGLKCVKAYNDWMIDEWCGAAPERFIPMTILPLWNPQLAMKELERCVEKGAKTVAFPENLAPLGLPTWHTDDWDPVFAAAQDANVPLSVHFGTSGQIPRPAPESPLPVSTALMSSNSMATLVDLIFSPVLHKFPGLKIALSEGGIGWIPAVLERTDRTWERQRHFTDINFDTRPTDLFRRHFWGCFISDDFGIANRHKIGIDKIMWECDYPHSDTNWPHSRDMLATSLADVPDEEAHKIVEWNARELYNFPRTN